MYEGADVVFVVTRSMVLVKLNIFQILHHMAGDDSALVILMISVKMTKVMKKMEKVTDTLLLKILPLGLVKTSCPRGGTL